MLPQNLKCLQVDVVTIALTPVATARSIRGRRIDVGSIPKPIEIVEDADLEFLARSNSIVILYPQKYSSTQDRRLSPHEFGIEYVTEVQPAGRRGGEAGEQRFD